MTMKRCHSLIVPVILCLFFALNGVSSAQEQAPPAYFIVEGELSWAAGTTTGLETGGQPFRFEGSSVGGQVLTDRYLFAGVPLHDLLDVNFFEAQATLHRDASITYNVPTGTPFQGARFEGHENIWVYVRGPLRTEYEVVVDRTTEAWAISDIPILCQGNFRAVCGGGGSSAHADARVGLPYATDSRRDVIKGRSLCYGSPASPYCSATYMGETYYYATHIGVGQNLTGESWNPNAGGTSCEMSADTVLREQYTVSVKIMEGQPPVAVITDPPEELGVDEAGRFNGSASYDQDENGQYIVEYKWEFQTPDGTVETKYGATIDYSWQRAGSYTVTLTVTDDEGWTNAKSITVLVYDCDMNMAVDPTTVWPFFPQGNAEDENPYATVTVTLKRPAPSKGCLIRLRIVPGTTIGHAHNGDQPTGIFMATESNVIDISFQRGETGPISHRYRASEVAGLEFITARVDGSNIVYIRDVLIKVPGLVELVTFPSSSFRLTGSTPTHPENHYGKPETLNKVLSIADDYYDVTSAILGINDMSLQWGGLFDIYANWRPDHVAHRKGTGVDISVCADYVLNPGIQGEICAATTGRRCKEGQICVSKALIGFICGIYGGRLVNENSIHCQF